MYKLLDFNFFFFLNTHNFKWYQTLSLDRSIENISYRKLETNIN